MTILKIGRRLVPIGQVAFVEPFDASANDDFKSDKEYKSRLILINREIVLGEQAPQDFASENGFHYLTEDAIAVNRSIPFRVEIFEPTAEFKPSKPYKTRLKWRDATGSEYSKLLLTEATKAITDILNTLAPAKPLIKNSGKRPGRGRRGSRRIEGFQN